MSARFIFFALRELITAFSQSAEIMILQRIDTLAAAFDAFDTGAFFSVAYLILTALYAGGIVLAGTTGRRILRAVTLALIRLILEQPFRTYTLAICAATQIALAGLSLDDVFAFAELAIFLVRACLRPAGFVRQFGNADDVVAIHTGDFFRRIASTRRQLIFAFSVDTVLPGFACVSAGTAMVFVRHQIPDTDRRTPNLTDVAILAAISALFAGSVAIAVGARI